MKTSYRLLGLGTLLALTNASQAMGQSTLSSGREDTLKGQIWTVTAQRIWADVKPKQTQPTPWATGTAFSNWALTTPTDPSEIGLLRRDVIERIGKGQAGYPAEVASAIIAVINGRRQAKKGALARVNVAALQASLMAVVPAKSLAPRPIASGDSDAADFVLAKPATSSPTVAEDPNPVPEVQAGTVAPTYTMQPLPPRYFGMSPAVAGTVLALLGALLGAGITYNQLQNKYRQRRHHSHPTPPAEPENSSAMNPLEFRKLQNQNKQLRNELQQIKQQLADLKKQLLGASATASAPAAVSAPAVAAHISTTSLKAAAAAAQVAAEPPVAAAASVPAELSIEELVGAIPEAPAPPLPPATRYGPVQETPFVEERKIVDSPLPQLALMLTVNPKNPNQATFTLNPNVDQARLIGDGLMRLQKFFDYDPPLGGRITLVTAATHGQLQRHADGWQVVQRARLTIS